MRASVWKSLREPCRVDGVGRPTFDSHTGIRNGTVTNEQRRRHNDTTAVPPFDSATHWLAKKKEHWTAKVPFLPGKPLPPKGVRRGEEGLEVFV